MDMKALMIASVILNELARGTKHYDVLKEMRD